jgi:hypothetical protein
MQHRERHQGDAFASSLGDDDTTDVAMSFGLEAPHAPRARTEHRPSSSGSRSEFGSVERGTPARHGAYGEDADQARLWAEQREQHGEVAEARSRLRGTDVLYGVAPLLAALKSGRRRLHGVFLQVLTWILLLALFRFV